MALKDVTNDVSNCNSRAKAEGAIEDDRSIAKQKRNVVHDVPPALALQKNTHTHTRNNSSTRREIRVVVAAIVRESELNVERK